MNLTTPAVRGCGKRKQGGLYAAVGLSANGGRPLEEFMIDPPIMWTQGPFRGTRFEGHKDGACDLVQWVGEQFYPFVPDFVEEGRKLGFSRLLSPKLDLSKVRPYQSRLIFIHSHAYAGGSYKLQDREASYRPHPDMRLLCAHSTNKTYAHSPCVFATWELSALTTEAKHRVDEATPEVAHITTPSVKYSVLKPLKANLSYSPALFLTLPLTHFEVIGKGLSAEQEQRLGDNVQFTATMKE